jgi:hypothetical protein
MGDSFGLIDLDFRHEMMRIYKRGDSGDGNDTTLVSRGFARDTWRKRPAGSASGNAP